MPFNINDFVKQREILRKRFEAEKTGEQEQYLDQSKLFKPIIDSHKEMENKFVSTQDATSNAVVPYLQELQRRNDLLETSQNLPFYHAPLEHSTPSKEVNFDQMLNTTDRENLQDLSLNLPSEVYNTKTYAETLDKIKTENRRLGQYLKSNSKATEKQRDIHQSQKVTLEKYKNLIKKLRDAAQEFEVPRKSGTGLVKPKRKRGRPKAKSDILLYNNTDQLLQMLQEHTSAKEAGNTGIDNYIVSILDELLRIKAITKDNYDELFKNIF